MPAAIQPIPISPVWWVWEIAMTARDALDRDVVAHGGNLFAAGVYPLQSVITLCVSCVVRRVLEKFNLLSTSDEYAQSEESQWFPFGLEHQLGISDQLRPISTCGVVDMVDPARETVLDFRTPRL
jgi:hypothetical protein